MMEQAQDKFAAVASPSNSVFDSLRAPLSSPVSPPFVPPVDSLSGLNVFSNVSQKRFVIAPEKRDWSSVPFGATEERFYDRVGPDLSPRDFVRYLNVVHRNHIQTAVEIDPLASHLLNTVAFQRLEGIHQMSVFWTAAGQGLNHSRAHHCVFAYWVSQVIANRLELPDDLRQLLGVLALLHDIGHPPFQHQMERFLRTKIPGFDHDVYAAQIIQSPEIASLLRMYGYDPSRLASYLDEKKTPDKNLTWVITEICDRGAYLPLDIGNSNLPPHFKNDALGVLFGMIEQLTYDPTREHPFEPHEDTPFRASAGLRAILFENYSLHEASATVGAVLAWCMNTFAAHLTPDFILSARDSQILDTFPPEYRSWFYRGIDRVFYSALSWPLDKFLPAYKDNFADPRKRERIKEERAQIKEEVVRTLRKKVPVRKGVVAVTEDIRKTIDVGGRGSYRSYTRGERVRQLMIVLRNDLSLEAKSEICSAVKCEARALMRHYSDPSTEDLLNKRTHVRS